jgi:hypothetical protein
MYAILFMGVAGRKLNEGSGLCYYAVFQLF